VSHRIDPSKLVFIVTAITLVFLLGFASAYFRLFPHSIVHPVIKSARLA
jgi:hypothetical protein